MKKLSLLTAVIVMSLGARAHADTITYLVDFYDSESNAYSGDATTDFGVVGPVTDVGGSIQLTPITAAGTNTPADTYTLGSATLTLNNPYGSYRVTDGTQDNALHLTGGFIYAKPEGAGGPDTTTLTLSGVTAGSTVNFQLIGSVQEGGPASVTDGTTVDPATVAGVNGGTGQGTFTNLGTFSSDSATSYGITLSNPGNEADFSAALITITTPTEVVPEPSTYLMFGLGFFALVFALRRKASHAIV